MSNSEEETIAIGKRLGTVLETGDVLLLQGDLGTGKSVIARGIAYGLGAPKNMPMRSPTFALIHDYAALRLPLRHCDLYRIDTPDEVYPLGLFDENCDDRVTLIEWGERLPNELRRGTILITLHDNGKTERSITLTGPERLAKSILPINESKKD